MHCVSTTCSKTYVNIHINIQKESNPVDGLYVKAFNGGLSVHGAMAVGGDWRCVGYDGSWGTAVSGVRRFVGWVFCCRVIIFYWSFSHGILHRVIFASVCIIQCYLDSVHSFYTGDGEKRSR